MFDLITFSVFVSWLPRVTVFSQWREIWGVTVTLCWVMWTVQDGQRWLSCEGFPVPVTPRVAGELQLIHIIKEIWVLKMQHSFELVHLEMYAALKQLHIKLSFSLICMKNVWFLICPHSDQPNTETLNRTYRQTTVFLYFFVLFQYAAHSSNQWRCFVKLQFINRMVLHDLMLKILAASSLSLQSTVKSTHLWACDVK